MARAEHQQPQLLLLAARQEDFVEKTFRAQRITVPRTAKYGTKFNSFLSCPGDYTIEVPSGQNTCRAVGLGQLNLGRSASLQNSSGGKGTENPKRLSSFDTDSST